MFTFGIPLEFHVVVLQRTLVEEEFSVRCAIIWIGTVLWLVRGEASRFLRDELCTCGGGIIWCANHMIWMGCIKVELNRRFSGRGCNVGNINMASLELAKHFIISASGFDKHLRVHILRSYNESVESAALKTCEVGCVWGILVSSPGGVRSATNGAIGFVLGYLIASFKWLIN